MVTIQSLKVKTNPQGYVEGFTIHYRGLPPHAELRLEHMYPDQELPWDLAQGSANDKGEFVLTLPNYKPVHNLWKNHALRLVVRSGTFPKERQVVHVRPHLLTGLEHVLWSLNPYNWLWHRRSHYWEALP